MTKAKCGRDDAHTAHATGMGTWCAGNVNVIRAIDPMPWQVRERYPSRESIARHLSEDHASPDDGETYASLHAIHNESHPYPPGGDLWRADHGAVPIARSGRVPN